MWVFQEKLIFLKKLFLNHLTNGEKDSIIDKRSKAWPVGQAVKTLASHAENMGSIPVRVTNTKRTLLVGVLFALVMRSAREPTRALQIMQFIALICLFCNL